MFCLGSCLWLHWLCMVARSDCRVPLQSALALISNLQQAAKEAAELAYAGGLLPAAEVIRCPMQTYLMWTGGRRRTCTACLCAEDLLERPQLVLLGCLQVGRCSWSFIGLFQQSLLHISLASRVPASACPVRSGALYWVPKRSALLLFCSSFAASSADSAGTWL